MIRSGKTTLARKLAVFYWTQCQQPALIFSPKISDRWPHDEHTQLFRDEKLFWEKVWATRNHVIICDEAAVTIARDQDLVPVFTMMNGNGHRFIVIGHSWSDLLPKMRQQITHIFLFLQNEDSAKMWANEFCDPRVAGATTLAQYQYLYCVKYHPELTQQVALTK